MPNSEKIKRFDESRTKFNPYGLTCELWVPNLMRRPDRHNEIEINYFPHGTLTYLFQDQRITIPEKRLAIFWGLVSHQIIQYEGDKPYFVCTIPLSQFLEWNLPTSFVDPILNGNISIDSSMEDSFYDEFLLRRWVEDINYRDALDVILLEMQARLHRMAHNNPSSDKKASIALLNAEMSQVENMSLYIAQNHADNIKVSDVGEAVGLHPDYANTIFKKAFGITIGQYIIEEKISHARRKLVTTKTNVTEIAFECGFNSISRFNAAFRKINQCTPREFRNKFLLI